MQSSENSAEIKVNNYAKRFVINHESFNAYLDDINHDSTQVDYNKYIEFMQDNYPEVKPYTKTTFINNLTKSKIRSTKRNELYYRTLFNEYLEDEAKSIAGLDARCYSRFVKYCESRNIKPFSSSTYYKYFRLI